MDHTSCTNTHYDVTDLWVTLLKRTGTYRFAKKADSTNICGWFWLSMKRLENWWLSSLEIPLTAILDMSPPHFPIHFLMFHPVFPQFIRAFAIFSPVFLPDSCFSSYKQNSKQSQNSKSELTIKKKLNISKAAFQLSKGIILTP